MLRISLTTAILVFCCFGASAIAESTYFSPISISLFAPVEFPPQDFAITGVRASLLYGDQRNVFGFDIAGVGNTTDQTFAGLAVAGGFNRTKGSTTIIGTQLAGLFNYNTGKVHALGVQLAPVNLNTAEATIIGIQAGLVNIGNHTDVYGLELGFYNRAEMVSGFQIGFINVATNLHGIQIGLLNYYEKGLFEVSPIINMGF